MGEVIAMVEKARSEGLQITGDVYTYPAGSTGLTPQCRRGCRTAGSKHPCGA